MEARAPRGRQAGEGREKPGQPAARRGGHRDTAPGDARAPVAQRFGEHPVERGQVTGRAGCAGQVLVGGSLGRRRGFGVPLRPAGTEPLCRRRGQRELPRGAHKPPWTEQEGVRARKGRHGVRRSQWGSSRNAEARSHRDRRGEGDKAPAAGGAPDPRRAMALGQRWASGEAGEASPPPRPAPSQHPSSAAP